VHEARAEARAEAEAAAEQRLAALDQARREEREAAVREALALGVRRVSARPLSGMPSCAPSRHTVHQTCHQAATERARRGSWHGLLARRRVPQAAVRGTARHGHG